jgi:hypothetical protein
MIKLNADFLRGTTTLNAHAGKAHYSVKITEYSQPQVVNKICHKVIQKSILFLL